MSNSFYVYSCVIDRPALHSPPEVTLTLTPENEDSIRELTEHCNSGKISISPTPKTTKTPTMADRINRETIDLLIKHIYSKIENARDSLSFATVVDLPFATLEVKQKITNEFLSKGFKCKFNENFNTLGISWY